MPSSYVDIDREDMEYVDGGDVYISNSTIKGIGVAIGINPLQIALAYLGDTKLKAIVVAGMAKVAGIVVGLSSLLTASTIANALIQGKGISIDWMRSKCGIIYGIDVELR